MNILQAWISKVGMSLRFKIQTHNNTGSLLRPDTGGTILMA